MGHVLRYMLSTTALLGVVAGQGNSPVAGLVKSRSRSNVDVSVDGSVNFGLPSSPPRLASRTNCVVTDGGSVNFILLPSPTQRSSSPHVGLFISSNPNLGSHPSSRKSSSTVTVIVNSGGSLDPKLLPLPTKPISHTKSSPAASGNANRRLDVGTAGISGNATPKPSVRLGALLNRDEIAATGLGGAVENVINGVGSVVAGAATPIASGLNAVVSGAVQIVSVLGSAVDSAVAVVPPLASGVGDTTAALGSTVKIAAVGTTQLVVGLLNVTLDAVSDVFTNATLSLLTVADDLVDALLHPHPRDPNLRGWTYFGCFHPSLYLSTKAVLKVTDVQAGMSAKICINLCLADAMDFATVQGNQCYCSNDAPGIDSGMDRNTGTDKCNALCQGSLTEYCGGLGTGVNAAMTVYKRVVSLITLPKPAYPSNWTYNGCFYMATWLTSLTTLNSYTTSPSGGTDGLRCTALCYATSVVYNIATVSGSTCYCSSLSIATSIFAGLGECSTPCASNSNETCGGTSKLGAALGISYIRRATTPSTPPPVPGTSTPSTWYNWGCYFGAAYLLDSILTGTQVSSLLDLTPDMSGTKCITTCMSKGYTYSMTIVGVCLCNNKPPTTDLQAVNQLLCNMACPNHATERCGGQTSTGTPRGRSLLTVFGVDEPPTVLLDSDGGALKR